MSNNWTSLSKLCFLKKLPQFFPWENSVRIMGIHTTRPPVKKKHLIRNGKRIDCNISNYVPFVVPGLHHHHRILYLTSTETPKIQYQKEVEVRVKSLGETRCMNPQKPKTKIKMESQKKYKEIYRMSCLNGYSNSDRIWLMKVLQQSLGETQSMEVETLPSHLMNFPWMREQKWNWVRVSTVYIRTFRRTQIVKPA